MKQDLERLYLPDQLDKSVEEPERKFDPDTATVREMVSRGNRTILIDSSGLNVPLPKGKPRLLLSTH